MVDFLEVCTREIDYKTIMAEFEEGFKGQEEDVNIVESETCDDGVSAKTKHYFGVTKMGNKWRGRIRDPKLKANVHLGHFNTPEEAALAVKNKKAEFEERLKGVDGLRQKRRGREFERRKLPGQPGGKGVRRDRGKFRVRIWNPKLKRDISFGAYSTYEEAAVVADRKRAELFQELYGEKPRGSSGCEDDDKVLQEIESEEAAVIADSKTAELQEVYEGKPRCSSECENDDKILQETESEEAAVNADMKRAELQEGYEWKPRGSSECEDDDKVLQETESEEGLRTKRRRDEFQGCKLPSGVRSEGGMFRVRIWHPLLKRNASFGAYSTCEEAAVVANSKRAVLRELYVRKSRGSSECEDDEKVLQETESEEAAVIADMERTELQELYWGKPRGSSVCEDDDTVLQETESEEAAVTADRKRAKFEEQFLGVSKKGNKRQACVEKSHRHEFEGRQLPKGITRECGKFHVRLWHPELNKYASFGYYSSCDEAVLVADRRRAELQEVYQGMPRDSSECEDDDKVLQETESVEAAVVADMEMAELRQVYGGKVGGSAGCEDDVEEVLQETRSEVSGNFECSEEQASDVTVPARIKDPVSNDRIWLGTYDTLAEASRCFSKEKTELDTEMKRAEFEEQFKGKADVNVVEDETCDGVLARPEHFLGVSKKGNKWQARVNVHLGYYSTPEEAALVVKNKKAEFEETLKGVDGVWKKGRGLEFERRKLSCGVRRDRGKFRVRIWHPELKKDVSFGAFSTYEEAAAVADSKRAEIWELYRGRPRGDGDCEDDDEVLQECETNDGGGSH